MAARARSPATPPRGRRQENDGYDDGYEEESKTPPSGYSTPPPRSRGGVRRVLFNISPSDNRQVNLRQELVEVASAKKGALVDKCRRLFDEDSPIKPTSTDTVPTLMRMATLGLLEVHDGTDKDVPDVLRGELSPYKSLTVPQLEGLYKKKFGRRSPPRWRRADLLAALVNRDREQARQELSNHEEAETIREKLTCELFEAIMDPSLGLLRGAGTFAKTLFGWCDSDISHVPEQILERRIEFLEEFNPKFMKDAAGDYDDETLEARKAIAKAVWKDIRDAIKYLNKCIGLSTDRADLYIRTSASLDNLDVFPDAVAVEPAASLPLEREPARPGAARRFYANEQNLHYFVEHAPAHLRQQQCRALLEIKQDFDSFDPISSDERAEAAHVQALLDRCLAAFKFDIRSTYYCVELPNLASSNTRSYLQAIRRLRGSNELDRAIIAVLPTGAGKTGIISLAGFTCNAHRVLAVVPNLEILKGMSQNFCRQGRSRSTFFEKCGLNADRSRRFPVGEHGLPKTVVISATPTAEGLLSNGEQCCAVRDPAAAIALDPDVVVTNIHQLTSDKLRTFPIDYFDLVIFDEGHHGAATNYRYVQQYFRNSYQLLLTATPFRSDRAGLASLHGDDSEYNGSHTTAAEAVARRIITNIVFEPVPVESFDIVDTVTRQVSQHVAGQEQILELAARKDIQRAAVYSEAVRASIMLTAMRRLRVLRDQDGDRRFHYIIAAAPTIDDAEEITLQWRALPEAQGLVIETVHSTHPKRDKVMDNLRKGKVDVIVQVNVLGEGFDMPTLSVACAFKVFRSIGPFMQFVGRVMRVQSGSDADEIQRAYFVAHPCMRYDKHFNVFTEERQDGKQELKAKGSVSNIDIANHVMAAYPPDDTLRAFADESAELVDRDYAELFRKLFLN